MATYSLRKFAQPEILKKIDEGRLIQFLTPYQDYLTKRGFAFEKNGDGRIDHAKLAGILLQPVEGIPQGLVDALYFIQEVSFDESHDELRDIADNAKIKVPADASVTNLAVLIWLHDPELIKSHHAETLITKPKSFLSFQAKNGKGRKLDITPKNIAALVQVMNPWFKDHDRDGCEIIPCYLPDEEKTYFLVRHGMPFKREGKRGGSVFYQPEVYDVVVYAKQTNEISIYNASTSKKERAMYLEVLGTHFFDGPDYFPNDDKYTLAPLLDDGANSLSCLDITGMEEAKLTEIQIQFQGAYGDRTIMKSKDLFASLTAREKPFPSYGKLAEAKFQVKFEHSSKPRTVKIKPPNVASFDRKEDAHTIEQWLIARGFIKAPPEHPEPRPERTQHDDAQAAVAYA